LSGTRRRDRYRLLGQAGVGGMGTVYRALDTELNCVVAVKVLRPEVTQDLRELLRLKREVVLASRVNDPHVVRVHDIGQINGKALIVMDWVEGESLAACLRRVHRLPPSQVCDFGSQIGHALMAIHSAHIVHRDLKPGNLLLRPTGEILVSDFGLARSLLPYDSNLTQQGEISGTPQYMAPEQLAGLPADFRSDLYSFGLVLLEMLTGTTALESLEALRLRLLTGEANRDVRGGELRKLAALDLVIRRCLRLDRTERYAGAEALLRDLELSNVEAPRAGSTPQAPVPEALRRQRRWRPLAVLLILVFGLLAPSAYLLREGRRARAARAEQSYALATSLLGSRSDEQDLERALESLDAAVAADPQHTGAVRARLETLIRLLEQTKDPKWLSRSRQALKAASARQLSSEEQTLFRCRTDLDAGMFPDVVRLLQADPALLARSADANRLLARALESSGEGETALVHYRAATHLSPESWLSHNDLGSALFRLGKLNDARTEFARVTELRPDLPIGYTNLGSALLAAGSLGEARRNYELSLERVPSPEAYFNLGVTAYYSREYGAAVPYFESALRMRSSAPRYALALADALRRLNRTESARANYARALSLLEDQAKAAPLSVEDQSLRALCAAWLGDVSTARSLLGAVSGGAENQDFFYAEAVIARLEGRKADCIRSIGDAVRHGYPARLIAVDPDFSDIR
jgi:eukaryotic-like serine/threonine-protein kinase